jgi:hypothetical protein
MLHHPAAAVGQDLRHNQPEYQSVPLWSSFAVSRGLAGDLVPDQAAAPQPASGAQRVARGGQLAAVGEQQQRGARLGDAQGIG